MSDIPFGKFGPGGDSRTVSSTPSDYLRWMSEQPWVPERYGQDLTDEIEEELRQRDQNFNGKKHWHENEEEADTYF